MQLIDAIKVIFQFYNLENCSNILNQLVQNLNNNDSGELNCALETVYVLCKHYRWEQGSLKLYEEMMYVIDKIAQPLTAKFTAIVNLFLKSASKPDSTCKSIVLMIKIFYSLNAHDLPEFFEVNLNIWMNLFHKLLLFGKDNVRISYRI